MNSTVETPFDLEPQETYRVYRNGQQVDKIRLITVNPESGIAHVAVSEYDAVEEIELSTWFDEYEFVPDTSSHSSLDAATSPLP